MTKIYKNEGSDTYSVEEVAINPEHITTASDNFILQNEFLKDKNKEYFPPLDERIGFTTLKMIDDKVLTIVGSLSQNLKKINSHKYKNFTKNLILG